jgi:hypothetical protein
MNSFMEENLAEERRGGIIRELNGIHLEEQALTSRVYRPNWFTRTMQSFGEWLIARGEGLVKRYEIPGSRASSTRRGYAQ